MLSRTRGRFHNNYSFKVLVHNEIKETRNIEKQCSRTQLQLQLQLQGLFLKVDDNFIRQIIGLPNNILRFCPCSIAVHRST